MFTCNNRRKRQRSSYLLVAADAPPDTVQLGVTDLSELELRHRDNSVALGDELAAVTNKEAVIARECLQDLQRQERMDQKDHCYAES